MYPMETFGVGLNDTVTVNHHVLNDQNELISSFLPEVSLVQPKVVLIDKVVLGSPKKGDGNWQYFWVQVLCRQHLWVQKFEEKSGKFKIQIYIFAGL